MLAAQETIAFRHCPEGYRVANLNASADLWRATCGDETAVDELLASLTTGNLRTQGGRELMEQLRCRLLPNRKVRDKSKDILLIWLAAIHEDERHRHLSLREIAVAIKERRISVSSYLPLPLVQAA